MKQLRSFRIGKHFWFPAILGSVVGASLVSAAPVAKVEVDAHAVAQRHEAREAARRADVDPHGARETLAVIPIVDSVAKVRGGTSSAFHIEVDNLAESEVSLAYAWQISDDQGRVLTEETGANVERLSALSVHATGSRQLPLLSDGFYRLTSTVVSGSKTPGLAASNRHDWWLEVRDGALLELDASQWLSRAPGASLATEVTP